MKLTRRLSAITKRFGTDIAGYVCLVLVVLLGPLPGPGGTPLLVAGLGLLSIHNKWAKRLLDYVKQHSENIRTILFPPIRWLEWGWDITAAVLLGLATYVNVNAISRLWWVVSIMIATLSTTIILFNRQRLSRLQEKFTGKR